jgi:hypothetical protein
MTPRYLSAGFPAEWVCRSGVSFSNSRCLYTGRRISRNEEPTIIRESNHFFVTSTESENMMTEVNMEKKIESNTADAKSIAGYEAQWQGLRRVPDKLPKIALLILAVEVRHTALPDT